MKFVGVAAPFDSDSEDLGGFTERIAPGAVARTLKDKRAKLLLVNHDTGRLLASTRGATLRLRETRQGLLAEADLPFTADGRTVEKLVERGDIQGMSFAFVARDERWEQGNTRRILTDVDLFEVSLITAWPAYPATTASLRATQTPDGTREIARWRTRFAAKGYAA